MFEDEFGSRGGAAADGGLGVSVLERRFTNALHGLARTATSARVDTGAERPEILLDPALRAALRRRRATPSPTGAGGAPVPPSHPGGDIAPANSPAWARVPVGAVPAVEDLPDDDLDPAASARRADSVAASALEAVPGGPGLAARLATLSAAEVGETTLIEGIAAFERLSSWAMAQQAVLVRELTDRRGHTDTAAKAVAAEIGARLGSTGTVGSMKVNLAAALDNYPEVGDALANGRIDLRKANVLTTREPGLTQHEHRRVVTGLLKEADRLSGPKLRNRLRKAALTLNLDAAAQRRNEEHAARQVTITPAPDAMAWVTAYLRADHAQTVKQVLEALTDTALADTADRAEDARTRDQIRADAFVDLFTAVLDRGVDLAGHPLPNRPRHALQVTVGAGTLLGLDDRPAHLGGYGPIPADLARELAQDATWRALFTDQDGHFKDLATRAYRPGADLTRTVKARHIECTFPGCARPSIVCDLDHGIEYDPTIAHVVKQTHKCNLHPLCRHHHNLKTSKRWRVRLELDGTVIWTVTRTGHQYRYVPDPPAGAYPAPPAPWGTDPPF